MRRLDLLVAGRWPISLNSLSLRSFGSSKFKTADRQSPMRALAMPSGLLILRAFPFATCVACQVNPLFSGITLISLGSMRT